MSESIEIIGNNAFENCENLKTVTIPNPVTNIGDSCFSYCTSLKEIYMSKSIEIIGNYAFEECENLKP